MIKESLVYRNLACFFIVIISACQSNAQNKVLNKLDMNSIKEWRHIIGGSISEDGKYAVYHVAPLGDWRPSLTVLKSLQNEWKIELNNVQEQVKFTGNSQFAVYISNDGKLCMQKLGSNEKEIINDVSNYLLVDLYNKSYLVYLLKSSTLIINNLSDEKEEEFQNIQNFQLGVSGKTIYVIHKKNQQTKLIQIDVVSGKAEDIYSANNEITRMIQDPSEKHLGFVDKGGKWYLFNTETKQTSQLSIKLTEDCKDLSFAGVERFEGGGKLLIVRLNDQALPPLDSNVSPVKIFSYQDEDFFNIRNEAGREQRSFLAAYDINRRKLTRLEYGSEKLRNISEDGSCALIDNIGGPNAEYYFNNKAQHHDFIVNLETGKKIISSNVLGDRMSADGKWMIGQNDAGGDLFCISVESGKIINLTKELPIPLYETNLYVPITKNSRSLGKYVWSKDGKSIVAYDRYDIWRLDPSGQQQPINLTNGIGRKNNIVFRFINEHQQLEAGKPIVVTAFNEETKENGFYKLTVGRKNILEKLYMGPYLFFAPDQTVDNFPIVKAKNADKWLCFRQNENEIPNLFWTEDFKNFSSVSDVHPENNYERITAEFIDFTTKDGVKSKAILYKPADFDPSKKYPVLFNYYQTEQTDKLHNYLYPGYTEGGYCFNYLMMLSRGYLVCRTDVHQKTIGETAHCIVDAVEGIADELAKRSYVDSKHYGLCGGSFAGYVTACVASMSNKFAAAVPISTPADLVSIYGGVPGLGEEHTENRQMGMGVSLGADPQRYLRNSPIAYTKTTNTPILIVNTLKDWNVNIQQGIEWFISLRREGKRAWMLQYQEEGHGIGEPINQRDLYTRMNQFFDHYLKDAPMPVWMSKGISINDTGVKNGFEYDADIKTPESSHLLGKDTSAASGK